MIHITRAYAILLRQFYLILHGKMRIMDIFYWPALDLVLWGFIAAYFGRAGGKDAAFTGTIVGALVFWYFFTRIQYGIIISFLEDVWTKNFINLFASPLSVGEYVTGLILASILRTAPAIVFMALLAFSLFSYNIFQFGFFIVPFAAVLFVFGSALGIMTTAIVLRFGPSSEFLAWSIPAFLLPFSGVFYPISALPELVRQFAEVLPSTYVFEGMRMVLFSGAFDWNGFWRALFFSVLVLIVAYLFIVKIYKVVLRRGLFTRFLTD